MREVFSCHDVIMQFYRPFARHQWCLQHTDDHRCVKASDGNRSSWYQGYGFCKGSQRSSRLLWSYVYRTLSSYRSQFLCRICVCTAQKEHTRRLHIMTPWHINLFVLLTLCEGNPLVSTSLTKGVNAHEKHLVIVPIFVIKRRVDGNKEPLGIDTAISVAFIIYHRSLTGGTSVTLTTATKLCDELLTH